ncbi:hypothetical protein BDW72DRAFT_214109 [Aspergillus terricola var. indicus]
MVAPELICANWTSGNINCARTGTHGCMGCRLVTYCGQECQRSHWIHHKPSCRSPLRKETWEPAWLLEHRTPAFLGDAQETSFGPSKYLWGNVPALDVLRLDRNEGAEYDRALRVLFAASGDLRHLVKTIAQLPSSYSGEIEITLNDRDFDIVGRNIILLLVGLIVDDIDVAVDCIIHLWYSALIRESDLNILQKQVRPLIDDICRKIAAKPLGTILRKTWTFKGRSLRVALARSEWNQLLRLLDVPPGLNAQQALAIRADITLAESRKDYRDRYMCCIPPVHRVAFHKFCEDGLVVPFGFPRGEFQVPNPTIYDSSNTWPMRDNADPRHGWPAEDIERTSTGAATADIYGKLFYYLRGIISSFLTRLHSLSASLQVLQVDAASLPDYLDPEPFSRIDVSNISDSGWLGIDRTLAYMIPLLQPPRENPCATLITLFMNAVEEAMTDEDRKEMTSRSESLLQYLPPKRRPISSYDPELVKVIMALDLVMDYNLVFDRYTDKLEFQKAAEVVNAAMKDTHTIIDKWPYRLKLRPGQPGAQEEFDRCLGSGLSTKERYVEWRRTG